MLGADIDRKVKIFGTVTVINPRRLRIGSYTSLNQAVFLNCRDNITIGNHVHISPGCQLHTGELEMLPIPRRHTQAPIVVNDNVWLASNVIVSPGVTIGNNSVIGAGSVVLEDVEAGCFYAGIPAKKIKKIMIDICEER